MKPMMASKLSKLPLGMKAALLGIVLMLAIAPSQPVPVHAQQQPVVATWMWNTFSIWTDRANTLDALQRNGITLLFLQIDTDIPADIYRSFLAEASQRGIEVHALDGAPDWVLPRSSAKLYQFIDWVKTFNARALPAEQFRGIHLDVEPHVLPEWYADQDAVIGLLMDTISGFVEEVKSDSALITGASLPVWLDAFNVRDGYGGRTTLSDRLIRQLDQTTLMAYRNSTENILTSVSKELDEAEKAGKPVIVGVETLNNYEPDTSFYDKGRAELNAALSTVVAASAGKASFAGYAVHEFSSWLTLRD
ncbi:MAG: amidase [Paenibacillus sp.]|uniref:hypothetical protein n=1 Tax=Paenibacillus sp. GCM10012303 TaxID=3317340 RepID=UPI0029F36E97|nr:amidase [Paenibacillus sp.]